MKKIAIIGASQGQLPICIEAIKKKIYTVGFAWGKDAICKNFFNKFYPISITNKDEIVKYCVKEGVDGVVSNASDLTALITTYVAEKLKLNGNNYASFQKAQDKFWIRNTTNQLKGLHPVRATILDEISHSLKFSFPIIVKPCIGNSKKGVSFVRNEDELINAITYAKKENSTILIEEFILGREISAETLSYNGKHIIIQITDKETLGPPHFVEIGHHQPALLSKNEKHKIYDIVPKILDTIKYRNGATHIEFKINDKEEISLMEINLRGGGDNISTKLIQLSTGFNYIGALIDISLNSFYFPKTINNINYSGIYYLCNQTKNKITYFTNPPKNVVEYNISSSNLVDSKTNYDRNGYIIYCGKEKLILE